VLLISLFFCVVFLGGSVTPCCSSPVFGGVPWLRVAYLFCFLCCVFGGVRDSVLLISFAFCVVFLVGFVTACCLSPVFGGVPWLRVAHLFSFLCCVFGGVRDCVLLISLVFCVVLLVGSVTQCCSSPVFGGVPWLRFAHLFSFLCCVFGGVRDSVLLISLVFCVVF
jgi:hypothetical protein